MNVSESLAKNDFERRLDSGQLAETLIARWLLARGNVVLPIYDVEIDTGKGPRLFGQGFQAAAPDIYAWGHQGAFWCEAKHKSVFSWHRITEKWTTGIDQNHWEQYQLVAEKTNAPVWLLFLHKISVPDIKDRQFDSCPNECPVGLFGQSIYILKESVHTKTSSYGRHGMIYWEHGTLLHLDTLDNLLKFQ